MYFMLDHIGLFDFINVSEWISASLPRPSPSVCPRTLPPMTASSSEVPLKVESRRPPLHPQRGMMGNFVRRLMLDESVCSYSCRTQKRKRSFCFFPLVCGPLKRVQTFLHPLSKDARGPAAQVGVSSFQTRREGFVSEAMAQIESQRPQNKRTDSSPQLIIVSKHKNICDSRQVASISYICGGNLQTSYSRVFIELEFPQS